MKHYTLPALGIVLVTLILVVINEFTDSTIVQDYAFLFIIGGMLLGVFLTKLGDRSKNYMAPLVVHQRKTARNAYW